nr:polyprotein [Sclerotinia sclerotiorum deltaflexivirus 3]
MSHRVKPTKHQLRRLRKAISQLRKNNRLTAANSGLFTMIRRASQPFLLLLYFTLLPLILPLVAIKSTCATQFPLIVAHILTLLDYKQPGFAFTYDIDWSLPQTPPTTPCPTTPGFCWKQILDFAPDVPESDYVYNGWMPRYAFTRLALKFGRPIPLIKVGHEQYHIDLNGSNSNPNRRLYRPSRLPQGWYGMRLDAFDGSALKTTVLALHVQDYTRVLNETRAQVPYAVRPKLMQYLEKAGLPRPLEGALPHPHAVHYAFENRMLQLAGHAIRNQPWYALFLKPEKVRRMRNATQLNPPVGYFNPVYDAKDITRYNQTPGGITRIIQPCSSAPVWFAHDVLHHMTPSSVGEWFDNNPQLNYLFATAVIPPELVLGIAPQNPSLYTFTETDGIVTYIPEGHHAGAYTQPSTCAKWLTTNRIVTPQGECLHVAKIDGIRAHNFFVISRPQLLPPKTTILDLPDVAVIPVSAHPLGRLSDRLTDPVLMASLVEYATRVSATNIRDLYAKTAAHAAENYTRYPPGYVRAAVLNAHHCREYDVHARFGFASQVWITTWTLLNLPVLSLSWLLQSAASRHLTQTVNGAAIWVLKMETWVSHPYDAVLPGTRNSLCDAQDVNLFYVPPQPTLAARLASWNARVHISLGAKLAGLAAWELIKISVPYIKPVTNTTTYLLGLNWSDTPAGLTIVLILYLYGFRVPMPGLYPLHTDFYWLIRRAYASYFFLPSAKLGYNAGLGLWYQVALMITTITKFFPRMNPLYHVYPSHWLHMVILTALLTIQTLIALLYIRYSRHKGTLPHHSHSSHSEKHYQDLEDPPSGASDSSSSSGGGGSSSSSSSGSSNDNGPFMSGALPSAPVVHSTPAVELDELTPTGRNIDEWVFNVEDDTPVRPPSPASSGLYAASPVRRRSSIASATSSVPSNQSGVNLEVLDHLLAHHNLAADPLSQYSHKPMNFQDPTTFGRVLRMLPEPAVNPDDNLMCVWECLGVTLGIAPYRLLACWLANTPIEMRPHFENGGVPREHLERVFTFFGVGVTLYPATFAGDECPRSENSANVAMFNPGVPALSQNPARAEWPAVTYYLGNALGGNFHLTASANPDVNAIPTIAHMNEMVGYQSRSVPLVEIKEILNVPVRLWQTAYHRLTGNLQNAAASLHSRFNTIPTYRAPLVALPVQKVRAQSVMYTPTKQDAIYARNLATDMKNNPQVLNLREMNAHSVAMSFDALVKLAANQIDNGSFARPPVELVIFHGAGGTGKSHALSNYLEQNQPAGGYNSSTIRFHTWLNQLRGPLEREIMSKPWAKQAGLVSHNFATGVMPLVQPFGGTLVLDDATQCWAGFIPLLVMCNPGLDRIVVTMDALQGRTVFPEADSLSRGDLSTSEWLSKFSDYYATEVYRYSAEIGDVLGIPTAPATPGRPARQGRIYLTSRAPRDVPLLVVSPRFSETQANGGTRCLTFRECQGRNIDGDVAIDLGGLTSTATEHAVWTALTRAQGNVFLVMGAGMSVNPTLVETTYGNSQLLSAIMCVAATNQTAEITQQHDPDRLIARAVQAHLASSLSPACRANLGLPVATPVVGKYTNETVRSSWLTTEDNYAVGDYYTARTHRSATGNSRTSRSAAFSRHDLKQYSHNYDLGQTLRHVTIFNNGLNVQAEGTGYTMPPAPILTIQHDPKENYDKPMNEATREILGEGLETSHQHIHDGPQAMLHHNGQDKVTQKASEEKRIRRGHDAYVLTSVEKKKLQQLRRGFAKFFDVQAWQHENMHIPTFASASTDYLAPWVSKRTRKAIDRSIARDPGDIPYNFTRLFLKGQYIKKEDKRYKNALPGQIVSEFPLGKQFRDAPYALYLERMALRHAFPSTYLHARASPADTSKWYQANWTKGKMTANDYTAWDNGCDRTTVAFMEWLMELSGMPREYIDLYVHDRMNTRSHLGPHKPKQESGDRYTWIANSLVNAAITGASLNCPKRTPCGYSGDDSIVLGDWRKAHHFEPSEWLMKPKPERGTKLTFCGMQFGGDDVYFDTCVIKHRAQNGMALGRSDEDYWRSIQDSIYEAGSKAPDYDEDLATAQHFLRQAITIFNLSL